MPTGYTSRLIKKELTAKEFIDECSYAFGAFIHLRDEDNDNKRTKRTPKEDCYHAEQYIKAKKQLEKFKNLSESQLKKEFKEFKKFMEEEKKDYSRQIKEESELKNFLQKRYDEIQKIKFPDSHQKLKEFCLSQISTTMYYDCNVEYHESQIQQLQKEIDNLEYNNWYTKQLEVFNRDIKYHENAMDEESKEYQKRIEWIKQLDELLETLNSEV